MSETFMFANCPVPLANYYTVNPATGSITPTHRYIAPEKAWVKPFYHWLSQRENINTIMNTVGIDDVDPSFSGWGDMARDFAYETEMSCAEDPQFINYCNELDRNPHISIDNPRIEYSYIITGCIRELFMGAARTVFNGDHPHGIFHRGEFITGGLSWDNNPTDIFRDVMILSTIDFFAHFPVTLVVNDTIVDWYDHNSNRVDPPTGYTASN